LGATVRRGPDLVDADSNRPDNASEDRMGFDLCQLSMEWAVPMLRCSKHLLLILYTYNRAVRERKEGLYNIFTSADGHDWLVKLVSGQLAQCYVSGQHPLRLVSTNPQISQPAKNSAHLAAGPMCLFPMFCFIFMFISDVLFYFLCLFSMFISDVLFSMFISHVYFRCFVLFFMFISDVLFYFYVYFRCFVLFFMFVFYVYFRCFILFSMFIFYVYF
jgi:hypothetical protein